MYRTGRMRSLQHSSLDVLVCIWKIPKVENEGNVCIFGYITLGPCPTHAPKPTMQGISLDQFKKLRVEFEKQIAVVHKCVSQDDGASDRTNDVQRHLITFVLVPCVDEKFRSIPRGFLCGWRWLWFHVQSVCIHTGAWQYHVRDVLADDAPARCNY